MRGCQRRRTCLVDRSIQPVVKAAEQTLVDVARRSTAGPTADGCKHTTHFTWNSCTGSSNHWNGPRKVSMQSLKSVKQQKEINTVESGEVTGERVAGARKKQVCSLRRDYVCMYVHGFCICRERRPGCRYPSGESIRNVCIVLLGLVPMAAVRARSGVRLRYRAYMRFCAVCSLLGLDV